MNLFQSPLQKIEYSGFDKPIYIKRDDMLHPIVSGNKWRKLKYTVAVAQKLNYTHIATFGGAYSNHMVATACACAELKIRCSIFIRGQEPMDSHYIKTAQLYGATLIQVERSQYADKNKLFAAHFDSNQTYFIAEGGKGLHALQGVGEIINEINLAKYALVHASATGTTAVGLAGAANKNTFIHSVAVLKNQKEQEELFNEYSVQGKINLHMDYTLGGYAKTTAALMKFCTHFIAETGIMIDPVYTGKALFALQILLQNELKDKEVVFLHTGGTLGIFSPAFMQKF